MFKLRPLGTVGFMAKKSKPVKPEPVELEEEEVTCPVCGKPVSLDVTSCPNCGAEFEEEEVEAEAEQPEVTSSKTGKVAPAAYSKQEVQVVDEEETAECPVCGKSVSVDVALCPNCGAEFEEEAEAEVAAEAEQPEVASSKPGKVAPAAYAKQEIQAVDEEETAECPVCGKSVGLSLSTCPSCGAEFEEEEVEEVIEIEEPQVEEEQEAIQVEEQESTTSHPTSVVDLRVIGVSLIILGIIGSQISAMIKWYWTWVPPIETNLGMFIGVAAVVIVVGLLVYMLVQRAMSSGKKVPSMMPNISLSLFLFGILALILIMLWNPINSALEHSNLGVAGAFLGILIVGVLSMIMGQRMTDKAASSA